MPQDGASAALPGAVDSARHPPAPPSAFVPLSARRPVSVDPGNPAVAELVYTSAARGLRAGSSGFCTVAMTRGMPAELVERLESLSAYEPVFSTGKNINIQNPVVFAHWRLPTGGRTRSVLTRIAFGELDYSKRPSKLAYHVVLDPSQQPIGGPAWTILQPNMMAHPWKGEPTLLPATKSAPVGDGAPRPCTAWEAATGDAGWAGILGESFLADPSKAAYLICDPTFDVMPLFAEASALLPPRVRWQLTFMTCFTSLPAGLECSWRCVLAGTPAAERASRLASGTLILDLTQKLGAAPDRPAIQRARAGEMLKAPVLSARE